MTISKTSAYLDEFRQLLEAALASPDNRIRAAADQAMETALETMRRAAHGEPVPRLYAKRTDGDTNDALPAVKRRPVDEFPKWGSQVTGLTAMQHFDRFYSLVPLSERPTASQVKAYDQKFCMGLYSAVANLRRYRGITRSMREFFEIPERAAPRRMGEFTYDDAIAFVAAHRATRRRSRQPKPT